ncbi:MAG: SDR family oxidoreductase [Synergistales bacterium]|nr:SDR family oxidoreductase [Synergistales bacterium]
MGTNLRHVIVTGAGSGIGKAIATALSRGCAVTAVSLTRESASALSLEAEQKGSPVDALCGDLSTREGVASMVGTARERSGPVDVVVNNLGIYPSGPFLSISDDEWDRVMDVCLKSCFWMCQETLPDMIEKKRGWIVNISSIDGKTPGTENAVYSAAKAAMISLTRSLAAEMAPYAINVNAIAPGWVATPKILEGDRWKEGARRIPFGRLAEPAEIADAVEFLVSEKARYITGETLNVNGGLLMD